MTHQNLYKVAKTLSSRTNIKTVSIINDYLYCHYKYHITLFEYQLFDCYKMTNEEKQNLLTNKYNQKLIKTYNNQSLKEITYSRHKFNKKFYPFLNYKWLELNGDNITDFYDFIQNKNYIYAKYDLKAKNDTKKIKIDLKNYTTVYNDLYLSKMTILESAIKQDEVLDRLNPNNLSFIRFITFKDNIIFSYLVTSKEDYEVTNSNQIIASINLDTGLIDSPFYDLSKNIYEEHPLTKSPLLWLTIPKWPRTLRLVNRIQNTIPDNKYLQIDIVMTNDGPSLKDISTMPNYQEFQLLSLLNHHRLIKDMFE